MAQTKVKTQKIIKVGNSYAVTLDKKFMDASGLQVNDSVAVQYSVDPPGNITIDPTVPAAFNASDKNKKRREYLASKITPELKEWVDTFIEENQEALDKLAVSWLITDVWK